MYNIRRKNGLIHAKEQSQKFVRQGNKELMTLIQAAWILS